MTPLLKTYIKLFDGHNAAKAEVQKKMLIQVLDDGEKRMTEAQNNLGKSSSSFNSVAGKLTELQGRFAVEFNAESEYFQTKMSEIRLKGYIGGAWFGPIGVGIAAGVIEGKLIPEMLEKMGKIEKFYENLNEKMVKAFHDIDSTKKILKEEIHHIGLLKVKCKNTNSFVSLDGASELRDMVIKSVEDLIANCEEYRTRHINKSDLI